MHSRKFKPENAHILEDSERKTFLDPDTILSDAGIAKGWTVADIGCGPGFFTIPLSELVGEEGTVYAIDVQEEMLKKLEAKLGKKKNVRLVHSSENKIPIESSSVDFAMMVNVLHELSGAGTLREAHRILKPNGILCVVDWKKIKMDFGPPYHERLTDEMAIRQCETNGFKRTRTFEAGPYNYGLIFEKVDA